MSKRTVDHRTIMLILAMGLFVIGVTTIGNADSYFDGVGSTATRSVDENAAVGTEVGSAFPAENLCFDPIRFKFPNHNDKFEYDVSTDDEIYYNVQIKTKVSLDYETTSSYTVTLIVEYYDYLFHRWLEDDRVAVTINVNDVVEGVTTGATSEAVSTADALPTLTSEDRERITSLLTLDTVIFNELFNASNDTRDWVELRNVTRAAVDLSGWQLIVITSENAESVAFPAGTMLPAGELLLFLNTDPNAPDMPLATSKETSYHYLIDETFTLPQEDFMLLLRSPFAWEDSAGSYLFGLERLPTTVDFALDIAWSRTKASVLGHQADAWIPSRYQGGLGYDTDTSKDITLGTPGHRRDIPEDANGDGIVNILDLVLAASQLGQSGETSADVNKNGIVNIQDLYVVARRLGHIAAAPSAEALTAAQVQQWLNIAKQQVSIPLTETSLFQGEFSYERGIQVLEQLLQSLVPKTTALLPNYPNPFNPETWIPHQLANPSNVQISIYDAHGSLVRQFDLGHQAAGLYQNRSRAAYWDGTNALGESVASGIYFYTLRTDDFSETRKMLILK